MRFLWKILVNRMQMLLLIVFCGAGRIFAGNVVQVNDSPGINGEIQRQKRQDLATNTHQVIEDIGSCQFKSFVGANDEEQEGTWVWTISGQTMTYARWDPGQPDNHGNNQDCAVLIGGGWDDDHCGGPFKYICEKTDTCDPNPCQNNGTCTGDSSGYACTCVNGYTGTNCETAAFKVQECSMNALNYTVYSGKENGITYIKGGSKSCIKTLSGTANESFLMIFKTCDIHPEFNSSTNSIKIKVVIQERAEVTTVDDQRYTVICTFGEKEDIVVTADIRGKQDEDGTNDVAVDVLPLPVMSLFMKEDPFTENYAPMSGNTVIELGTIVLQQILLDKDVPNYSIFVKSCSLEVRTIEENNLLRSIELLDPLSSCSGIGADIYPDFSYHKDNVTRDGTTFVVPTVSTEFKAFVPTLTKTDLEKTSVKLVVTCRVQLCFLDSSACEPPTCGLRRRRRAVDDVDDGPSVKNYDNLSGSFQIKLGDKTDEATKEKVNTGPDEESADFVGSIKFWAIIISTLAVLIIASITACAVFLYRKRGKGTKGHYDDSRRYKRSRKDSRYGGRSDRYPDRVRSDRYPDGSRSDRYPGEGRSDRYPDEYVRNYGPEMPARPHQISYY